MPRRLSRNPERGSVMILVMIILVALLGGGAIALHLQLSATKQVGLVSHSRGALYCAEAGLTRGRQLIGANPADWAAILDSDSSNDPAWYPITGDIDNPADGVGDFIVTIRDNEDEPSGSTNDPTIDQDLRVFLISRCTRYDQVPRELTELVIYAGGGGLYRNQSGQGAGNTNNAN